MKKVIVTGFEPFGPYQYNPTQKSALDFNGKIFGDREVVGIVLPSTYNAWGHLAHSMQIHDPYAVIGTGLASSAQGMRIKSLFYNEKNGKYPDAQGYAPQKVPIIDDPAAPRLVKARSKSSKLFKLLADNNIPAEFSKDADRFICNTLGYYISVAAQTALYVKKTLFVHTAWTTDYKDKVILDEGKNFLPTELYYKGLELLIRNI